jgi:hypothetical protein
VTKLRWIVGITAALAVGVVTWSPPGHSPLISTQVALTRPTTAAEVADRGPDIAHRWTVGGPQRGIHVYWQDNPGDSDDTVHEKARRVVDQVVGFEANAIAVSFPFFVTSPRSDELIADERTPSPHRLSILIEEARRAGLRTTLRPLMDGATPEAFHGEAWRGTFAPTDRERWYAAYSAFLRPYLRLAEDERVATFVVGVELSALQRDPQWTDIVNLARSIYHGEVGYSANWDAYPTARALIPADRIGIDAYPLLGLPSNATQDQMTTAWTNWLARITGGDSAQLVLDEIGGAAESVLQYNPARTDTPGEPLNEGIQSRWFGAACQSARNVGAAGVYYWKLDFSIDVAAADPLRDRHDSFLGRQAENTVRSCLDRWGGRS